jgi:hypothetical protein
VRLIDAVRAGFLAAMLGIAAISAAVVSTSINQGDSASAWIWAADFVLASVVAAVVFWRVM